MKTCPHCGAEIKEKNTEAVFDTDTEVTFDTVHGDIAD